MMAVEVRRAAIISNSTVWGVWSTQVVCVPEIHIWLLPEEGWRALCGLSALTGGIHFLPFSLIFRIA